MRIWNFIYFALVAIPLILIAIIPELRIPAQKMVLGNNIGIYDLPQSFSPVRDYSILNRIRDHEPKNLDTQIWRISQGDLPDEFKKFEDSKDFLNRPNGKLLACAEFLNSHPDNLILMTQAINSTSVGLDGRVAGPWENDWRNVKPGFIMEAQFDPDLPTPNGSNVSAKFSRLPTPRITSNEIELGLRLARRGQQLEPNNTFFDWAVAGFLFSKRRDEEAVQTLIKASHKTDFNVHWAEYLRLSLKVHERAHPFLAEEKIVQFFGPVLFYYFHSLQHTTQLALWNAMQLEDRGDSSAALNIEVALIRLNAVRCRKSAFSQESTRAASDMQMVFHAPEFMKWARVFFAGAPLSNVLLGMSSGIDHFDDYAADFSSYAQSLGENDSSREVSVMAADISQIRKVNRLGKTKDSFLDRPTGIPLSNTHLWSWVASIAALQVAIAAATWILITPFVSSRNNQEGKGFRNIFAFYLVMLGSAISLATLARGFPLLRFDWKQGPGCTGFPNSDEGLLAIDLGYVSLYAPFVLGAIGTIMVGAMRTWRPENITSIMSPETEVGRPFHKLFPFVERVLRLATLFLVQYLFLFPWYVHLLWVVAGTVIAYFLIEKARWFLAKRRIWLPVVAALRTLCAVTAFIVPVSLWFLLGALFYGGQARAELDGQINSFLDSEKRR